MQKLSVWYCNFTKNPYLCIVFFIVLDLRLTKIGTQRSPFFFAHKSDTSKNKNNNRYVIHHPIMLLSYHFQCKYDKLVRVKHAVIKYISLPL